MHRSSIHISEIFHDLPDPFLSIVSENFSEFLKRSHLQYPIHDIWRMIVPVDFIIVRIPEKRPAQIHRLCFTAVKIRHTQGWTELGISLLPFFLSALPPFRLFKNCHPVVSDCQNIYFRALAYFLKPLIRIHK